MWRGTPPCKTYVTTAMAVENANHSVNQCEPKRRGGARRGAEGGVSAPGGSERRTVFEVESEQRWRIWLLFALLLALVATSVWVVCLLIGVIMYVAAPVVDLVALLLRPRVAGVILGVSALLAVLYWFSAQVGARGRLLRCLHGEPLDPADRYHQRLADIVEELRLATGGPRIECRVVATRGLNAFSFSDLRGGGVIGVTEGALARLSRQQLEAVVAHEFAQILSGTYVTVTVGCLLFGTSAALAEDLQDAMLGAASTRAAPLVVGVPLIGAWLWLLDLASSVVLAAVDRERQRQADTAAARYTRDPLSLAEALRIIGRHPGSAGFVPDSLAALCIRGADDDGPRGLRRREPSLDQRVAALLTLANAAPDEFERQVREADEQFEGREHWAAAPGERRAAAGSPSRAGPPAAQAAGPPAAAQVASPPARRPAHHRRRACRRRGGARRRAFAGRARLGERRGRPRCRPRRRLPVLRTQPGARRLRRRARGRLPHLWRTPGRQRRGQTHPGQA